MAYDTTLLFHKGKWWLFTNIKDHVGASSWDELYLFYSNNPISKTWYPHPMNPIVTDVRNARSAGKIFTRNGNLFRPSQDCSKRYGYRIKINKIMKLSEDEYEEMEIDSINPDWDKNIKALHTLNYEKEITINDGCLRRFKFFNKKS